jgi:hypothetical protein
VSLSPGELKKALPHAKALDELGLRAPLEHTEPAPVVQRPNTAAA